MNAPEYDDAARDILTGIYQTLRLQSERLYEVLSASMALTTVLASSQRLLDLYQIAKAESDRSLAAEKATLLAAIDTALAKLRSDEAPAPKVN
jgi:hypothetical protein